MIFGIILLICWISKENRKQHFHMSILWQESIVDKFWQPQTNDGAETIDTNIQKIRNIKIFKLTLTFSKIISFFSEHGRSSDGYKNISKLIMYPAILLTLCLLNFTF